MLRHMTLSKRFKEARYPGLPAFAEKCPQYLLLDYKCHEKEDVEGAKICTVNIYGSKINPA